MSLSHETQGPFGHNVLRSEDLAKQLEVTDAVRQGDFFTFRDPVTHAKEVYIPQTSWDEIRKEVIIYGSHSSYPFTTFGAIDPTERVTQQINSNYANRTNRKEKTPVFIDQQGSVWIERSISGSNIPILLLLRCISANKPVSSSPRQVLLDSPLTEVIRARQQKKRQENRRKVVKRSLGVVVAGAAIATVVKVGGNPFSEIPHEGTTANSAPSTTQAKPTPSSTQTEMASPAPSDTTDAPKATLRVATWNTLYNNSTKATQNGIKILFNTNNSDIIGLQEALNHTKKFLSKIACESEAKKCNHTLTAYPGVNGGSAARNQIIWKTERFSFIKGNTQHAASDPDVNNRHFKHDRYINWVRLKDKETGQDLYFIDVHAPNGIDRNGSPIKKRKGSVKAHEKYMHNLVKTVKQLQKDGIPIVLVGDLNVNFRADNAKCTTAFFPCRAIDPLMEDMWIMADVSGDNSKLGTQGHNNRVIDRVYFSETNKTAMMITKAYVGTDKGKLQGGDEGSDHKPVNVEFQITLTDKQSNEEKTKSFSLTLDGVKNFRDAAGTSNGAMKKGVLYRSAKLEGATNSDIDKLAALLGQDGTVIDLREKDTVQESPDAAIPGVENKKFPITSASSAKTYEASFVENAADRKQLSAAIEEFANSKGPVLVHCTAGKDRTGWFTWTIQMINAEEDNKAIGNQAMREYLRSNQSGGAVKAAWVEAAMKKIKEKYGTFENYVEDGLGISAEDMAKIGSKI